MADPRPRVEVPVGRPVTGHREALVLVGAGPSTRRRLRLDAGEVQVAVRTRLVTVAVRLARTARLHSPTLVGPIASTGTGLLVRPRLGHKAQVTVGHVVATTVATTATGEAFPATAGRPATVVLGHTAALVGLATASGRVATVPGRLATGLGQVTPPVEVRLAARPAPRLGTGLLARPALLVGRPPDVVETAIQAPTKAVALQVDILATLPAATPTMAGLVAATRPSVEEVGGHRRLALGQVQDFFAARTNCSAASN